MRTRFGRVRVGDLHVLGDLPRRNPLPAVFGGQPDQDPLEVLQRVGARRLQLERALEVEEDLSVVLAERGADDAAADVRRDARATPPDELVPTTVLGALHRRHGTRMEPYDAWAAMAPRFTYKQVHYDDSASFTALAGFLDDLAKERNHG